MKTSEAIGEVRKFNRFIKAFEHLAEVADELAKADQLVKERQAYMANLNGDIEKAEAERETHAAAIETQKSTLSEAAQVAKDEYDEMAAAAHRSVAGITEDAEKRLEHLSKDADKAAKELRDVRTKVTKAQQHYDGLKDKLIKAQEQAKQILGGA